ncbi:MAG: hypothetical protein ACEQR8_09480, partial [Cypionkella sp.]
MPFYNYSTINRKDGLITPPLNLKGFSNINVTFKHAYAKFNDADAPDSLKFYISTDCGSNWTLLPGGGGITTTHASSISEFEPATSADWCSTTCYTL